MRIDTKYNTYIVISIMYIIYTIMTIYTHYMYVATLNHEIQEYTFLYIAVLLTVYISRIGYIKQ